MSIEALCWAFRQHLPCAEKFVLVALADMADMDRKCWPSQALLAERCGIARETVNRQIKMLANAGMIRVEQRANGHGKQTSLYFVLCDQGSHPNVTMDHTHVTGDHIEPLRNPKKEDSEATVVASGAEAPDDPVKDLFSRGRGILGASSGSLLSKARRDHGDEVVLEAIAACELERPIEPVQFFIGCLKQRSRKRSAVEKFYAGAMEAADEFTKWQQQREQANGGAGNSPFIPLLDGR